jgi:hypothetical protein
MADKLGHPQHPLRRLAALLMVNSGHGFFRAGLSTAYTPGAVHLRLPRLVTLHRHKPLEYPDRRVLGAPFDLIS